jgi:hypothetical protein
MYFEFWACKTKFKVVELTQIRPTPFKGGTSSNINIKKPQYKRLEFFRAQGLSKDACISFH